MSGAPKIQEIANRLYTHLQRMEMAQPDRGSMRSLYWNANAFPAGSRVGIRYIGYQHTYNLTKADALRYLQWLDAGNEGRHNEALRAL